MQHPTPTTQMAKDWSACKQAYDDAVFFTGVSKGWAEASTQGWRDRLAELAMDFESRYKIEFDPKKPIVVVEPYETAEEASDFDASVAARTSHMQEARVVETLNHTLLPWAIHEHHNSRLAIREQTSPDKGLVATVEGVPPGIAKDIRANAAFIVRACNAYYDLVAALVEARAHIDGEIDVVDGHYGQPAPNEAMRVSQIIDAAIARAKGK